MALVLFVSPRALMDPLDFISLGIRLANSNSEADRRTAMSRAYYGAFHVARRFLINCGICFSHKETYAAEIHRKVQYCLSECGNIEALRASGHLRSLRDRRNEADYDLESSEFNTTASVLASVRVTTEIVDIILRLQSGMSASAIREKVRAYARDVLRLTVQDD